MTHDQQTTSTQPNAPRPASDLEPSGAEIALAVALPLLWVWAVSRFLTEIAFPWLLLFVAPITLLAHLGWAQGVQREADAVFRPSSRYRARRGKKLLYFLGAAAFVFFTFALGHGQPWHFWLAGLAGLALGWRLRPWLRRRLEKHLDQPFLLRRLNAWQGALTILITGLISGVLGGWFSLHVPGLEEIWQGLTTAAKHDPWTLPQRTFLAIGDAVLDAFYTTLKWLGLADTPLWYLAWFVHFAFVWGTKTLVLCYASLGVAHLLTRRSLRPLRDSGTTRSAFYATLIVLLMASFVAALVLALRDAHRLRGNGMLTAQLDCSEAEAQVPALTPEEERIIRERFSEAMRRALQRVEEATDAVIRRRFAQVRALVKEQVDEEYRWYSDYKELGEAFFREEAEAEARTRQRFSAPLQGLDDELNGALGRIVRDEMGWLQRALSVQVPRIQCNLNITLAPTSMATRLGRLGIAAGIASAVGTAIAKKAMVGVAKVAAKLLAKKGIAAAGGAAGGAAAGAIMCGPLGPVCGVGGLIVAWVIADAALVKLDEIWNREDRERELMQIVDEGEAHLREQVRLAVRRQFLQAYEALTGKDCRPYASTQCLLE